MMKFTVLVIALVLAPGLHASAVISREQITNYPGLYVPAIETRPLPIETIPELRPEAVEVVPETKPLPLANPCEACFSYMATLIDELTETVEPQLPEYLPEVPAVETLPQPAPELPEIELRPLPIFPEVPQVPPQIELRPLPIFPEVPQIELRPLPIFPEVPQVRPVVPTLANF